MRTLAAHFFGRFFDNEIVSPDGDMQTTVVQVLGLLATPSLLAAMWLLPGFTGMDRYFFVLYSMVVAGFVMVLEWDMLFPDRRDYLILVPLPLTVGRLFLAKLVALFLFVGAFLMVTNVFSVLLIPPITAMPRGPGLAQLYAAHAAAVLGGGAFMALAFAALQGVLINILGARSFSRISPLIQMIAMAVLVMMFLARPLVLLTLPSLLKSGSPLLYWFPPYWFLALYEVIAPSAPLPSVYPRLAALGVQALGGAALLFAATYLVGYRRHCRRVLESLETGFTGPGPLAARVTALLNRLILKHPIQRASFYFMAQTVMRSGRHRLFLAGYSAAGLALALLDAVRVVPRSGALEVNISEMGLAALPLTLGFFLVSGLRAAFNFPTELRANWLFQLTESERRAEHLAGARKFVVLIGIVPLFLLLAPLEFARWGWATALMHMLFGITLSLLLMELLFYNFRKVPFTCSYFPGKVNLAALGAIYLFGYTTYAYSMSALEMWLGRHLLALVIFYALAFSAIRFLSRRRDRELNRGFVLSWEDTADPVVRQLNLT